MNHVLTAQQFDREHIESIFRIADKEPPRDEPLHGMIMACLFYEPSTRTRFSFESAMHRLGGEVITTENAREFSSAAKGETLEDTIRIVNSYADLIVLRHHEEGAAERAAQVSNVSIINAGDGGGQHPTQALLDLYTIRQELGRLDKLTVALVGDLKHGRTARSLAYMLGKFTRIDVRLVSPVELRMGDDIKAYFSRHGVSFTEYTELSDVVEDVDVLYMTRIQKERFADPLQYDTLKGSYCLTPDSAAHMKDGAIIMHPLPRVDEIAPEIDTLSQAVYFRQAAYGLRVRMALLRQLMGRN